MNKKFALTFLIFLFSAGVAEAVVFDMNKAKFGSYLRSTYWNWANNNAFSESSGTGVSWSDQYTNLMSYEFGFLYNSRSFTWRFGLEFIQPAALAGVSGKDSVTQAKYYTLDSSVTAYIPKVGLELNLKTWSQSRLWMMYEYGAATLTVQNNYTFTAAGTAKYGIGNFREAVSSYQSMGSAALGFETLMSDNTTFCIEAGYRFLNFTDLNQSAAVTNFQGAQPAGASAKQNDGTTKRDLGMSMPYAAINLRIWVY